LERSCDADNTPSAMVCSGTSTDATANLTACTLTECEKMCANSNKVGRCRLTVSKPELKARLVSALETKM
jgi:hypothetical protein